MMRDVRGSLDSQTLQLLMGEEYEQIYGIFNHEGREAKFRPLASVALHPKEDVHNYSMIYRAVVQFMELGIKDFTGLSLTEYLNLPHEYVQLLVRLAGDRVLREKKLADAIEANLAGK